ncbi:MAG: hypothetical protein WD904_00240 [Dehalococcoidia bacterium]
MTQEDPQTNWRWIAAIGGAFTVTLVATLLVVLALDGGDDSGATATPSATPTPVQTPAGQTPSPAPSPPETAFRLVYREFGQTEDIIWRVPPADPTQREELARIPHREGFGIKPSLSPDGKLLAYLSLPEYALSAQSSQADAFVMDLETDDKVLVAQNVDMTFAPLWSPDGKLLYMRQLAGPEFLAADVLITRVIVPPLGKSTPTPTATPRPSETQDPTPEPTTVLIRDSIAHVLSFAPVGFSADKASIFFVQLEGGTQQGSLLGMIKPATSESVAAAWKVYLESLRAADAANNTVPPPAEVVTPAPTPAPESRLVVQMSEQLAFDYALSPDGQKFSYLVQEFAPSGDILNRAYVADIVAATAAPVGIDLLPAGHHLRPIWFPDGRLTFGILPGIGSVGTIVVVNPDGTGPVFLASPLSGFDEPRKWSPDGQWLAVSHSEGDSLTNRHDVRLDVIGLTGFRATVITGADNATEDSVLGWVTVDESEGE